MKVASEIKTISLSLPLSLSSVCDDDNVCVLCFVVFICRRMTKKKKTKKKLRER